MTNGIHALKLMRPRTAPSIRIGVIAAKTNWKYTSVDFGKFHAGPPKPSTSGIAACFCISPWPRTDPGCPQKFAQNLPLKIVAFAASPAPLAPKIPIGCPKAILKPHSTQIISTTANATNDSIIEFTDQRFCMTPPYSTTRPGTLISPTRVAAVICQALSPGFSQCSYGIGGIASPEFDPKARASSSPCECDSDRLAERRDGQLDRRSISAFEGRERPYNRSTYAAREPLPAPEHPVAVAADARAPDPRDRRGRDRRRVRRGDRRLG